MVSDGLCETRGTPLFPFQAGDEVAGFAFEFVAFVPIPFPGAPDELPRSGKEADVPFCINPGEVPPLNASVAFFPVATPFIGDRGELVPGDLVDRGLIILESEKVVATVVVNYERRFFWALSASPVTSAPASWAAASLSSRRWATGSSQSSFFPL